MEILVLVLIGINIFVYFLPYIWNFSTNGLSSEEAFVMMGWKSNPEIRDGEYYRLISSNFLHADIFHLLFNMYALWQLRDVVYLFTPVGFSIIYLLSGIGGSLTSYFFNPSPSIGASGAIFGLVGALLAFSLLQNNPALISNLLLIIVINVVLGVTNKQIDNFGHLGGLVTGFTIGLIFSFLKIRGSF